MKRILLLLLILILTNNLFAQDGIIPNYRFRLGLTAHPTVGWIMPENGKGNGVSLGFSYGLMADFNFADYYSFATGLTVATINGKSTEINPSPYYDAAVNTNLTAFDLKYMLQYLEVPLTLKLKMEKIGLSRWYGQFGISNDFNIGAKQDVQLAGKGVASDLDIKDNINFYRAGLVIGGGVEYDIASSTSIMVGLTYNNGFTNISDDKSRKVRNYYVGTNFGLFF